MIILKDITIYSNIIMSKLISSMANAGFGMYDRYKKNQAFQRRRRNRRVYRSRMYKGRTGATVKTITYLPKTSMNSPLPECYHTRFCIQNSGYYAAGASVFNITSLLNGLIQPFDSASFLTDGYNLSNPVITLTNQSPTGLEYLMPANGNGPYTRYTVLSSYLKITVRTTDNSDVVQLIALPLSELTNVDVAAYSSEYLAQQPQSKSIVITSDKGGILKTRCQIANYLGVSKRALKDDLSGNYDGSYDSNPVNLLFWGIKGQSKNGGNFAGNVSVDIKQWFNVCLWNDANGIFPTVNSLPAP